MLCLCNICTQLTLSVFNSLIICQECCVFLFVSCFAFQVIICSTSTCDPGVREVVELASYATAEYRIATIKIEFGYFGQVFTCLEDYGKNCTLLLFFQKKMKTKMQSWVDLFSGNGDVNGLFFDDFQVETHVEQVADTWLIRKIMYQYVSYPWNSIRTICGLIMGLYVRTIMYQYDC